MYMFVLDPVVSSFKLQYCFTHSVRSSRSIIQLKKLLEMDLKYVQVYFQMIFGKIKLLCVFQVSCISLFIMECIEKINDEVI